MRLRPPYSVDEIRATPFELDGRPFRDTRRAQMWQARIDYWNRLARFFGALTFLSFGVFLVCLIVLVSR